MLLDKSQFHQIMNHQDFLSLFFTWTERKMSSAWVGKRYAPNEEPPTFEAEYFGAKHVDTPDKRIHPLPGVDPSDCVPYGNGIWREKIYLFMPDTPLATLGSELQSEFFLKYDDFIEAMNAMYKIKDTFNHLVFASEIRMVAGDNIPLSPAKGQPKGVLGLHFTWKSREKEILKVLPLIEQTLEPFQAKPHPGKLFLMSGDKYRSLFGSDLDTLREIMALNDPTGKFRN